MKVRIAVIAALILLAAAGCTKAEPVSLGGASAQAHGISLSLALKQSAPRSSIYLLTRRVSVSGSETLTLPTKFGELASIVVVRESSGEVVFDSGDVGREAAATQPDAVRARGSEVIEPGTAKSATYSVRLQPGKYTIKAHTFGPQTNLVWGDIDVP